MSPEQARPKASVAGLKGACPTLNTEVETLAKQWLEPVLARLEAIEDVDDWPRSKHFNDPVWKTFEIEPQEVLLIDSPLLQRLRGVKQLGLAHLVFPGANHDRFEHLCGVVHAADKVFRALQANAERRRAAEEKDGRPPPTLTESHRRMVRLAALLHDVGHGPFSHAIEPVVATRYRDELKAFNVYAKAHLHLDSPVAIGELISVLIAISTAMKKVLKHALFAEVGSTSAGELQMELATLIMGARRHGQLACLSAIISGQADADKLDYMDRDAHHSGMPIEFDTDRLLSKLEIVRCTPDNIPADQVFNRVFAEDSPQQHYFDIGIAASGVGALEQMLIGRAFLYDRLYHHHKVRAADAMAQRLLHYAQEERGSEFELSELYLPISDEAMIRLLGGDLFRTGFTGGGERTANLAQRILSRSLYVRAFAFRASFHTAIGAEHDEEKRISALAEAWTPVSTGLSGMAERLKAEAEIVSLAKALADQSGSEALKTMAKTLDPSHVIVDLAENRVKPVTINVHAEDGSLEAPNLFFDPARWSNVYDLQKRTGYVYCDRAYVRLIALATKIYFFEQWGYVASPKADRLTKTVQALDNEVLNTLEANRAIDENLVAVLTRTKTTRVFLRSGDVNWPADWHNESADFEQDLLDDLRTHLPQGMSTDDRAAVRDTLAGLASFIDMAHKDGTFQTAAFDEAGLQRELARHLRARSLQVREGEEHAGGETDLIVSDRALVENKIVGEASDPFAVKPDAPYQALRYAAAKGTRVYFTLTGYIPKGAAGMIEQTKSIRVEKVEGLDRTALVIKAVVPYGMKVPSREKKPKAS